jgi:hypothetical protein
MFMLQQELPGRQERVLRAGSAIRTSNWRLPILRRLACSLVKDIVRAVALLVSVFQLGSRRGRSSRRHLNRSEQFPSANLFWASVDAPPLGRSEGSDATRRDGRSDGEGGRLAASHDTSCGRWLSSRRLMDPNHRGDRMTINEEGNWVLNYRCSAPCQTRRNLSLIDPL